MLEVQRIERTLTEFQTGPGDDIIWYLGSQPQPIGGFSNIISCSKGEGVTHSVTRGEVDHCVTSHTSSVQRLSLSCYIAVPGLLVFYHQ